MLSIFKKKASVWDVGGALLLMTISDEMRDQRRSEVRSWLASAPLDEERERILFRETMLMEAAARILAIENLDVENRVKGALQTVFESQLLEWSNGLGEHCYLGNLLLKRRLPAYKLAHSRISQTDPVGPIWEVFAEACELDIEDVLLKMSVGIQFAGAYKSSRDLIGKYRLQLG
jgi:hypothetical protein